MTFMPKTVAGMAALGCIGLAALSMSCAPSEEEIQEEFDAFVAERNHCAAASECTLISPGCPLGCGVGVRVDQAAEVQAKADELVEDWESGGRSCDYECLMLTVDCLDGRCEAVESGMFTDGCNPGGGEPDCPSYRPSPTDACSVGTCCNYESMSGVTGCICGAEGWTCTDSACACTGG